MNKLVDKQALRQLGTIHAIRWRKYLLGEPTSNSRFVSYIADAGMCNRLKSHLIAHALAAKTGREVLLRWIQNRQCGARYEDLFEWGDTRFGRFKQISLKKFPGIRGTPEDAPLEDCPEQLILLDAFWQWITPRQFDSFLGDYACQARNCLKPLPSILDRVESLSADWPKRVIGVHVRRGDFTSINGWTVDNAHYVRAMHELQDKLGRHLTFVLASDASNEELLPITQPFSGQVLRIPPSPRENQSGIAHALVTMLLLSRTSYLLLTPRSSFGEMAAFLGGQPFEYVTRERRR